MINKSQLEHIREELSLSFKQAEPHFDASEFLQSLISGSEYSLRHILYTGILLAKGSCKTKMKLLLDAEDEYTSKSITIEGLSSLISDAVDLSVSLFPLLALGRSERDDSAIHDYIEKCELKKETFKQSRLIKLMAEFSQDDVLEKHKIVRKMDSQAFEKFLCPRKIREFCHDGSND